MKKIIPLLLIYVLIQQRGQTVKATWTDGQPVNEMLALRMKNDPSITSFQIVDQATFNGVPDLVITSTPDPIKEQAILDAKNTGKTTQERLDALIKAVLP